VDNAAIMDKLDKLGAQIAAGRDARERAKQLVPEAIAAGIPEADIARRLGVDRMTVRNWLGKR
jgi:DNA invertase Pin-like site-specific DNA recombinase